MRKASDEGPDGLSDFGRGIYTHSLPTTRGKYTSVGVLGKKLILSLTSLHREAAWEMNRVERVWR